MSYLVSDLFPFGLFRCIIHFVTGLLFSPPTLFGVTFLIAVRTGMFFCLTYFPVVFVERVSEPVASHVFPVFIFLILRFDPAD